MERKIELLTRRRAKMSPKNGHYKRLRTRLAKLKSMAGIVEAVEAPVKAVKIEAKEAVEVAKKAVRRRKKPSSEA